MNTREIASNTRFLNHLVNLDKKGKGKDTIRIHKWTLEYLAKNADIDNPDEVNRFIGSLKRTGNYKNKLTHVYATYLRFYGIEIKRPYYAREAKPIKIPTQEKLQMFIANAGKTMSMKLKMSLETGVRPTELHALKVKDVDVEQRLVYPTTAKHGAPRTLKISPSLATLLTEHIARNGLSVNDQLFNGDAVRYGKEYRDVRSRLADKLKEPSLRTIRLYDFRHYFATMLYHKTKDILYVKQQLGHKRLETTLVYTQILATDEADAYICKTAKDVAQIAELVERGYEYVTDLDELKIFRKRK